LAAFQLDHNVSTQLAALVRGYRHSCQTTKDLGFGRAKDPNLLLWAANEQHIFVIHDEGHFEMLHGAWRLWSAAWSVELQHAGIIAVHHSHAWPRPRVAREIDLLVRDRGPLTNQCYKFRLPDGWLVEN
jgi:hypothetical protein